MPGIIVDIGTGNGKFVYQLAKENPDRLIIGIDPGHRNLEKTSTKIYKKETKGGLKNAFYVLANVEDLPEELSEVANQVFVNFPWGSLLSGIVLVQGKTWDNIKRICRTGAIIDLVFGYDTEIEKNTIRELKLPYLNSDYIKNKMISKLQVKGFDCIEFQEVKSKELKTFPSTWAKKMSFSGKCRKYYYLRLKLK